FASASMRSDDVRELQMRRRAKMPNAKRRVQESTVRLESTHTCCCAVCSHCSVAACVCVAAAAKDLQGHSVQRNAKVRNANSQLHSRTVSSTRRKRVFLTKPPLTV